MSLGLMLNLRGKLAAKLRLRFWGSFTIIIFFSGFWQSASLCLASDIRTLSSQGPSQNSGDSSAVLKRLEAKDTSKSFIRQKLLREGFKKKFVDLLISDYETKGFQAIVELNILLYLRKSDYHGPQVGDQAVSEVRVFLEQEAKTFRLAEKRYGVDRDIIASLLWIESRLGMNSGTFHVPSVYLHLLQAPRVVVQKFLMNAAKKYKDSPQPEDMREIVARTHRKSKWALGELRAIQKIYDWKWKIDRNLRGSFSGAFGWPQFLPSSYTRWARGASVKVQPDISQPQDAILSVAYYLKDHGWKSASKEKKREALFQYNNSWDYADAIMDLAERASARGSTAPASGGTARDGTASGG